MNSHLKKICLVFIKIINNLLLFQHEIVTNLNVLTNRDLNRFG